MRISGVCRKGFPLFLLLFALASLVLPPSVSGASGESGGGGVTVVPDGSFLIQIVNFVFLIWVLNMLLYRPIRKILAQRKEKIDGLELSIETSDKDALEKNEAFAAGIKDARARGLKEKETLLQQATDEEKSIIAEINRKAQEELAEVRVKVKNDAEVVRESLQKEVDNFADQIFHKILGRTV
ncbi:MAG: ATP synthase F0 subunit B [Desulfobacterales bacterium]|nr:MAG: ATP synthase F0 subunit B [Desulfobacterales bacterium]